MQCAWLTTKKNGGEKLSPFNIRALFGIEYLQRNFKGMLFLWFADVTAHLECRNGGSVSTSFVKRRNENIHHEPKFLLMAEQARTEEQARAFQASFGVEDILRKTQDSIIL